MEQRHRKNWNANVHFCIHLFSLFFGNWRLSWRVVFNSTRLNFILPSCWLYRLLHGTISSIENKNCKSYTWINSHKKSYLLTSLRFGFLWMKFYTLTSFHRHCSSLHNPNHNWHLRRAQMYNHYYFYMEYLHTWMNEKVYQHDATCEWHEHKGKSFFFFSFFLCYLYGTTNFFFLSICIL